MDFRTSKKNEQVVGVISFDDPEKNVNLQYLKSNRKYWKPFELMQGAKNMFQDLTDRVDEDFNDFLPLKNAAKHLSVPPSYIILPSALLVFILSLFTTTTAHFLITLYCVIYPAYKTFKTMDQIVYDTTACKNWITFWIVFCFMTVFDRLISTLLFFLPAYYACKFIFFVWLIYPNTKATNMIRQSVFRPQLKALNSFANNGPRYGGFNY